MRGDFASADLQILEASPAVIEPDGITFNYTISRDGVGLYTETQKRFWTKDDKGTYMASNPDFKTSTAASQIVDFSLSPESRFRYVDPDLVPNLTIGGMQGSVLYSDMVNLLKGVNKGMSKESIAAVDEILIAGDQTKQVYTLEGLASGNYEFLSGQRPYTSREIKNYSDKLAINRGAFALADASLRRKLVFEGIKDIGYINPKTGKLTNILGKPHDSVINMGLQDGELVLAPQLSNGGFLSGGQIANQRSKLNEKGYVSIKLTDPVSVNGTRVNWMILSEKGQKGSASIKDLPKNVLPWNPWYVPRKYEKGYVFIKDEAGNTVTASKSMKSANEYISNFKANQVAKREAILADKGLTPAQRRTGLDALNGVLHPIRDRDLSSMDAIYETANQYGGLYTTARKTELLRDIYGNPLERLSWGEATQKNLESLATIMPLDAYKIGITEQFSKSIDELAKRYDPTAVFPRPGDTWKTSPIPLSDPDMRKSFEGVRNYLENLTKFESNQERSFNRAMMNIAEASFDKGLPKGIRNITLSLGHLDPVRALKAATYHTTLGALAPRQLYMQLQNASISMSMYPLEAPAAVAKAAAMRALLYLSREQIATLAPRIVGKEKAPMLIENLDQFRRSGLLDSVLTNGDINSIAQGFTGGSWNMTKGLMDKSTVFFQAGETSSRLITWNIAKSRWIKANPKRGIDNEAILEITRETLRLSMNMQRENSANFQLNATTALATQFQQVNAKMAEKVVSGGLKGDPRLGQWTLEERSAAVAGQFVLYGLRGAGAAGIIAWAAESMDISPLEVEQNYPEIVKGISDGIVGATMSAFGFDNTFGGDAVNLVSGWSNTIVADFANIVLDFVSGGGIEDELAFMETVLGASHQPITNGINAAEVLAMNTYAFFYAPSADNFQEGLLDTVDAFGDVFSSWRKATQFNFLSQIDGIKSRANNKLFTQEQIDSVNWQTMLMARAGIPLDKTTAYYAAVMTVKERQTLDKTIRAGIKDALIQFRETGGTNWKRLNGMKAWFLKPYEGEAFKQKRIEIMQAAARDILAEEFSGEADSKMKILMQNWLESSGETKMPLGVSELVNE